MSGTAPEFEFPELFEAFDTRADLFQWRHFASLTVVYSSLFLASSFAISDVIFGREVASILYLVLLGLGVGATVTDRVSNFSGVWYASRALAESIKTLSWRYAMRSDPFEHDDGLKNRLETLIDELLSSHKKASVQSSAYGIQEKRPSEVMNEVRGWSFSARKSYYLKGRIEDQLNWYKSRAAHNRKMSKAFFWAVIALYTIGFSWAFLQLANPNWEIRWVSEPVLVLAAGFVGYSEARRYTELSNSYELAGFEIGELRKEFRECTDESILAVLVEDAEQAFSREHTQWIARRA